MVVRRALAEKLPNQAHYFNAEVLFKRLTPAGPDHAQIAASAGIADYVDALAQHHGGGDKAPAEKTRFVHDLMRAHETALLQPLLDYLSAKNSVRLLGPRQAKGRAPTVAMVLPEPGAAAAAKLAGKGVMASGGDFYAVRCLHAQGVDPEHGALRVSFVHYTSAQEVAKLIDALDQIL